MAAAAVLTSINVTTDIKRKICYMVEKTLPVRLRVLRAERSLSLRQVENLTGVAKETLSEIERGVRHPQDRTLSKLARGYGISLKELLDTTKDMPEEEPVPAGKVEAR
jgi:transcriptional regulator with XRE-family HTH domain